MEGQPAGASNGSPYEEQRARADALLAQVGHGNEAAFAQLYDIVVDAVFGTARKVLRNPSLAEEVTQQVMLEIWRLAPRFDRSAGSAMTFVLTIAHRRAVDAVRREAAHERRAERAGHEHQVDSETVDETVIDNIERKRVAAALGSLTPLQREAVDLAFTGGYTHLEIASILELPLGTVKTRIRDGLIRLRDALGEGS